MQAAATLKPDDVLATLEKLGELKAKGILTDEEFAVLLGREIGHIKSGHMGLILANTYIANANIALKVLLFPLLLTAVALAGLAALALRGWLSKSLPAVNAAPTPAQRRVNRVITVLLLLALLYPLWPAWQAAPEQRELAARAQQWDARDAVIRAQIAAGATQIQTVALDSIAGLEEMQPDPNHWVNVCAARYYNVDEITAQIP